MSPVWIESENIKPSLLIATKMLDNNFPEEFLGKQQYDLPCQIAHDQSGQELSSNDHLSHLKDFAAVKITPTSRYRRQELSSSQSEKTETNATSYLQRFQCLILVKGENWSTSSKSKFRRSNPRLSQAYNLQIHRI